MSLAITDLQTPFDPTAYTSITGAQLQQLVSGAFPNIGHGMVLVTADTAGVPEIPDATTNTKWQNYFWLRIQGTSFTVYAWNPNTNYILNYNTTFANTFWNPITTGAIPDNSITGSKLVPGTVTKDKILSVDLSQVDGAVNLVQTSTTPAAGDISGTFGTGFNIGANKVTTDKISKSATVDADRAVTTDCIKNGNVTLVKIIPAGSTERALIDVLGTTPAWVKMPSIVQSTSPVVTTANLGKIPRVLTAGAGDTGTWEMVTPTGANQVGLIYQRRLVNIGNVTGDVGVAGTTYSNALVYGSVAGATSTTLKILNFLPISATSKIVVKIITGINNSFADNNTLGLYVDITGANFSGFSAAATANAGCSTSNLSNSNNSYHSYVPIIYEFTSGQTTRMDFNIKFAAGTNTPTLKAYSNIEVIEYAV